MIDKLFLKVRRGETPFYRALRSTARKIQTNTRFLHPLLRLGFNLQSSIADFSRWQFSYLIREPLGRIFDEPKLILKNRVDIGHNMTFVVNKEIVIEDDVNVVSGVQFMDTDAYPRDAKDRIADLPPKPEEIKPVRICRRAWIGQDSFVLKGVTVGEGAIVGVNSVLITDVPAYSVAMANPARVAVKNLERPVEA